MTFISRSDVAQRSARWIGTTSGDVWGLFLLAWVYYKIYFPSEPFSRYLDDDGAGPTGEGSLQNKLKWLIMFAGAGVIVWRNRETAFELLSRSWIFLIPFAWFAITMLWSSDPDATLRRTGQVLVMSGIAFGIAAARPSPADFLKVTAFMLGLFMLVNVASIFAVPHLSLSAGGNYLGVYNQKNSAGAVAAMAFIIWIFLMASTARFEVKIIALFGSLLWLFFLFGTKSKTSLGLGLLVPAICISLYYVLRLNFPWRVMSYVAGVVLLAIVGWIVLYINWTMEEVGLLIFDDLTFTNRTFLWSYVLDAIAQRPILGHGFGAFWLAGENLANRLGAGEGDGWAQTAASAHNGYLNLWLESGLVGLLICVGLMLLAFRGALGLLKRPDQPALDRWVYVAVIGVMLFIAGRDMMEMSLYRSNSGASLMFFMLAYLIWMWRGQTSEQAHAVEQAPPTASRRPLWGSRPKTS